MQNPKSQPKRSFSSLWFIGGLIAAAATAITLDGAVIQNLTVYANSLDLEQAQTHFSSPREPAENDTKAAEIAWDYIEANTQPETGFVNSVDGFPSTTLWDQGSYLLALAAARKLDVIEQTEFDARAAQFITSLGKIELIEGNLPNKVYHTTTLKMTDYDNSLRPDGIGWSALDIARLLMGLRIIEKIAPHHGADIRRVLADWDFAAMATQGELVGSTRVDGDLDIRQEGRIGYEQYGARAAALWGMDVLRAASAERILRWENIGGVDVPVDRRSAARFGTINPTLSEPYLLMALELGFDSESAMLAKQVYEAQKARFDDTGILTFVSEDHIDQAPYFVYSAVFSNARPWGVMTHEGKHYPDMRIQSTKAIFGWDAIFKDDYTQLGRDAIADLAVPEKGWYAGIYERDGIANEALTLNTNAVILEALHYAAYGPLWNMEDAGEVMQTAHLSQHDSTQHQSTQHQAELPPSEDHTQ